MKITQKDADELAKLKSIDLFALNQNNIFPMYSVCFDDALFKELTPFIEDLYDSGCNYSNPFSIFAGNTKRETKATLLERIKKGACIKFERKEKIADKQIIKFYNSLVGKEVHLLESLFKSFAPKTSSSYFFKKDLLLPDSIHRQMIDYLRAAKSHVHFKINDLKINYLYSHRDKILDKNKFKDYYENLKEETIYANNAQTRLVIEQNIFLHKLTALILFERPMNEFDQLLKSNDKMLVTPASEKFINKLDANLMPGVVAKIKEYVTDDYKVATIHLEESPLTEKIYTIELEVLALKNKINVYNAHESLKKVILFISEDIKVDYHPLNDADIKKHKFVISAKDHHLISFILKDIINHPNIFRLDRDDIRAYLVEDIKAKLEKQALSQMVVPNTKKPVQKL